MTAERKTDLFSGRIPLVVVSAVAAGMLVPLLGRSGLWDPCESVAAEIAREAAMDGSWLPLRFDGEPVHGLPPLFFWIEAAGMAIGGRSEWAVRLPLVLMVVLFLISVLRSARRLMGGIEGTIVALALATSSFVIVAGRHTSPDLAACMLVTAALLETAAIVSDPGACSPADRMMANVLLALVLPASGLLGLFAIALAIGSGLALGTIPVSSLRALLPDRRAALAWIVPLAWIVAGTAASGTAFLAGLLTVHPMAAGDSEAFRRAAETSFVWQIRQAGHMAYPWFIAFPAAVLWLVSRPDPADVAGPGSGRHVPALHLLLAFPAAIVLAAGLWPGYMPMDTALASLPLVVVSAWGLGKARRIESLPAWKVLMPLGALLVVLGAGSQGVDLFWNPRLLVEMGGYLVDRVHPDMGPAPKIAVTALAIVVGASAAPALFFRRWSSAIPAALVATGLGLGVLEIVAVFEQVEPYMSAGPLARAYAGKETGRDALVAAGLDPQVRGGHVFYFERRMKDLGSIGNLAGAMKEAAGKERLVIVSSRVREVYNEVYGLSCGVRIVPLNEERRWYSISAYDGPPPMPDYTYVYQDDAIGERIERPLARILRKGTEKLVTLLGWSASAGEPGAAAGASAGAGAKPTGPEVRVGRGSWLDLHVFWRAEKPLEGSWKVLLEAIPMTPGQGSPQIKGHHNPACGRHPTYLWKTGEIVDDRYFLFVPLDAKPGSYRLRTGLYREAERMTADAAAGSPASGSVDLGVMIVE